MLARTENFLPYLWSQTWWSFDSRHANFWSSLYHYFNLFEGTIWIGFGVLVLRRMVLSRRHGIELVYAALFVTFGITDFIEARWITAPLVLVKGGLLVALLLTRQYVLHRMLPPGNWW